MHHVSSPQRQGLISVGEKPRPDIYKHLWKAARRSTHKRHQTGCVITNGTGGILASGCSHSSSFRLNELHSIHAEIHASWNSKQFSFDQQYDRNPIAYIMTIARKSENITYSAPCLTCAIALKTRGINTVVYSVTRDEWETVNLADEIPWNLKKYPTRRK